MNPNVVHEYYKKITTEGIVMLQVDPNSLEGIELLINNDGHFRKTKRQFDEEIFDDLEADDFKAANALEFNLYLKGIGLPNS